MGTTVTRLVFLIVTILVTGFLVFAGQRYQVSRLNQLVLERAARAEEKKDFPTAEQLYREHLDIVPNDQDAKLKYADVLLKGITNPTRQDKAAQILTQLLDRSPGNNEIRRRLAELSVERGNYGGARPHLEILLKTEPEDGTLYFLLGRCQEAMREPERAAASYADAIKYGAPKRVEAYRRRATLLRTQLDKAKEAEQVINEMVSSQPDNYRVYLERARYHSKFKTETDINATKKDFQRALKEVPNDASVYVNLAEVAQAVSDINEARRILETGLKILPSDPLLHKALAVLEASTGSADKAIASLHRSLELLPDQADLHWLLAMYLADRGDTTSLLLQIEQLKRLSFTDIHIRYLESVYHVNAHEWSRARESLVRLQPDVEVSPEFKARVNTLLARCYNQLGDADRQREALLQAIRADPRLPAARLGLAETMVRRGEIEQAIAAYYELTSQNPRLHGRLASLLIMRNQQRSVAQQDWNAVDQLIKTVRDAAPQASEWVILQADSLLTQGKIREAQSLLDEARSRSPQDLELWVKAAEILRRQRKYSDARNLLDHAQKSIGERVDLRIEQARLLIAQGGADVSKVITQMARDSTSFNHGDRRRLLQMLAVESSQLNDLDLVASLWTEVANLDPETLEPQLYLFDLAGRAKNKHEIENRLDRIRKIDGADGTIGRYYEILYQLWQVQNTSDRTEQASCAPMRGR